MCSLKVVALYQWWNYLESLCPENKTVLRINMDETAVKTFIPPGLGLVTTSADRNRHGMKRVTKASRKQQRSCLTHVAFVCDRPEIQPRLPHVIVGNEAVLPKYIQNEIEPQLNRNVFLVRRKSAWVDANFMVKIVELLAAILDPLLKQYQPILLMDALPAHLAPKVLRAAAKKGIWIIVVPAKLTFLVQPADTHAFYRYKMYLRKRYLEAGTDSEDGAVHLRTILKAMNDGVRYVFQAHAWKRAFDENGFGHQQRRVRARILQASGLRAPLVIDASVPTVDQFQGIWPAGNEIPFDALFAAFLDRARDGVVARPAHHAHAPEYAAPLPWRERLRPRRSGSSFLADNNEHPAAPSTRAVAVASAPCQAHSAAAMATPRQGRRVLRPARPIAMSRPSARSFVPAQETRGRR